MSPDLVAGIDANGCLVDSLNGLRERSSATPALDERLQRALAVLDSTRSPGAIGRAAASAGLSPSRLRALAQVQLEVPLARWGMLCRLQRASRALSRGASLAEAATDAGFADQAQLTRHMRRSFGITPATVAALVRDIGERFVQDGE